MSGKIALSHIDRRRVGAGRGERRVLIVDIKSRVEIWLDGVLVADGEADARIAVTGAARARDILRHARRIVATVGRVQPTEVARTDAVSVELELASQDRRIVESGIERLSRLRVGHRSRALFVGVADEDWRDRTDARPGKTSDRVCADGERVG